MRHKTLRSLCLVTTQSHDTLGPMLAHGLLGDGFFFCGIQTGEMCCNWKIVCTKIAPAASRVSWRVVPLDQDVSETNCGPKGARVSTVLQGEMTLRSFWLKKIRPKQLKTSFYILFEIFHVVPYAASPIKFVRLKSVINPIWRYIWNFVTWGQ